ncbi:DUF2892 domain-containing protein [Neobacillus pocheonensis]|uniref:DUF2892 domain-containing protein n=1 Tax=Neobacillus pocheonensis TaxID=363869 RepID=A0ABT0WKR1_9BACI|nr:DUF2892 domain-containing protein [Neobacillus pocheonensis]
MNIKPNIGILNALIRITIGLSVLSWCTAKLVKYPWRDSYLLVALCGAMKVAEGIVRFCPLTALYERCQDMMPNQPQSNKSTDSMDGLEGITNITDEQAVPYNPS